jgi:ketosteroid isomerase-like protein
MNRIRLAARVIAAVALASAPVALASAPVALSRAARAAAATSLDTLAAAERAFSALSVERGMKEAFLANLADDGVVFRPAPMNGRQVWRARANPAATLEWAPDYAEISGAADLGVTSGPWEFRPPPERNQPTAHGHFISVWRRGKDGAWQVAVDMGVGHEKPAAGLDAVELVRGPVHPKLPPPPPDFGSPIFGGPLMSSGTGSGWSFAGGPGYISIEDRLMSRAITGMMTAERSLVYFTRNHGAGQAYAENAANDVRVYRNEMLPMVGMGAAQEVLAKRARRVEIAPNRHGMSASRDLGYSYGLLIARASASARPDTVSYLHVWRRDGAGPWKLALDVENEFGTK